MVPPLRLVLNHPRDIDWLAGPVEAGLPCLQMRFHDLSAREWLAWIESVRSRWPDLDLVVSGRIDIALAAGIERVQLPANGIPVADARRIAPGLHIGVSVHSVAEAIAAEAAGADGVTFGHVYGSASHPDVPRRGIAALTEVIRAVQVPVIAIGGITEGNLPRVYRAGARGFAVTSDIVDAPDPAEAVRELLERWKRCDSR